MSQSDQKTENKKESTKKQPAPKTKQTQKNTDKKEILNLDKLEDLFKLIYPIKEINDIKNEISDHLKVILKRHEISENYLILFLYDVKNSVSQFMADRIYNAIPDGNEKSILHIIHSGGGRVEPAYLISKTCKENSKEFKVAIPRKAKSAATLIAFGGDEIHMGSMSELGPIDPQFAGLPALGLGSSLESLAKVVSKYPASSEMFSKFLSEKLDLRILGYFERVSESAKQYALRLLKGKKTEKSIDEIAHQFVYEYKDHSFVVDKDEARLFLGNVIKTNTAEYKLANDLHRFLNDVNRISEWFKNKTVNVVGDLNNVDFDDKQKDD